MSTEETPVKPEESTPAPVETTETPAAAEIEPTAAIISPDVQVVQANLEKAEPVTTEAAPTTEEAAAPTEETSAEAATPAVPEKKEAKLLGFLKKFPTPKAAEKKPVVAESEPAAASEPVATEPVEEKPFEGDTVQFRTHGGLFSGFKTRYLVFGKEEGYSQTALSAYFAAHKIGSLGEKDKDKINAAWDNAAHATVTGSGLLIIVKAKALDIPLNIINLAEVTAVAVNFGAFTVKTEHFGDYEFQTGSSTKAAQWKTEIEARIEAAKAARAGVQEQEKYKESLALFKENKLGHAKQTEAVTSDEEGAISGDDSKRPKGWTRRISGSFARFAGSSKEATTEAPKEDSSAAPAVETAAATEAAPVTESTPETAVTEAAAEPTAAPVELSKKEKRKSFTGFGIFKGKQTPKETSPEPAAKEVATDETATAPVETAEAPAETEPVTEPSTTETPAAEETPAATTESKVVEKAKRGSLFGGLLTGKKDKTPAPAPATTAPVTNGDVPTETVAETTEPAAATTEETPAVTETGAIAPTPKKESLSRRLTSQFKSFGRSKSPSKSTEQSKVSDEAPKIDTAIETKPEDEPLSTTEAPLTTAPATSTEAVPAVVQAQA